MEEIKVIDDLYMFSSRMMPGFTFNQYLLLDTEALLVHTGSMEQAGELVPRIKKILGNRNLSYIFIAHFEGDECGGLSVMKDYFPQAKPVCSQITMRQLKSFGLFNEAIVKAPDETLKENGYHLSFLEYPSEMHLWQGLLAWETKRGLLFSSDLFVRREESLEAALNTNWADEVNRVTAEQIPSPVASERLKQRLLKISPKYIAPGHGPFLKV